MCQHLSKINDAYQGFLFFFFYIIIRMSIFTFLKQKLLIQLLHFLPELKLNLKHLRRLSEKSSVVDLRYWYRMHLSDDFKMVLRNYFLISPEGKWLVWDSQNSEDNCQFVSFGFHFPLNIYPSPLCKMFDSFLFHISKTDCLASFQNPFGYHPYSQVAQLWIS